MKIVKCFPNSPDNTFCLQACVLSVLSYYFQSKFSEEEVAKSTDYHPKFFSWCPRTVVWLNQLGLDVKLYSPGDYERIGKEGLKYLKESKGQYFELEKKRGDYQYLPEIQIAIREMLNKNLWVKESLSIEKLRGELKNKQTLAIGKTIMEWLDGKYIEGTAHFVTVVKEYSPMVWLVQDPGGRNPVPNRKVNQYINNESIFPGDIILVKGNL